MLSDTQLADVLERFPEKCREIYEPDPAYILHFVNARISMVSMLEKKNKKTEVIVIAD